MIPEGQIFFVNHNDDGSVTVGFRNETKTYSDKASIAAIVKRKREQAEQRAALSLTFPTLHA